MRKLSQNKGSSRAALTLSYLKVVNNKQKVVNNGLKCIKKWLDANKLALNVEKTNFIIFHSPQTSLNEHVIIKFGKQHVSRAKYVKFHGLLFDENLSWNCHLNELSKF